MQDILQTLQEEFYSALTLSELSSTVCFQKPPAKRIDWL